MPVIEVTDGIFGTIVGITQAFCLYRLNDTDALCVAAWPEIALSNICPAAPLLPTNVTENDRRNAGAGVLRELLALQQFGLTTAQQEALDELVAELCDEVNQPTTEV
jgi:hypothetical protein